MKGLTRLVAAAAVILLVRAGAASAQDSLAAARQLYGSASYDEALSMLDRLKAGSAGDPATTNLVEQYRAFCLLAVGHRPDAERAMETIVAADPTFRPSDADISPRLQSVFRDVRARTLPVLVRQRYAAAKASFDEKAYQSALDQFDAVLRLLEMSDVIAADPGLADLRTVASGFRDLAKAALAPPPPLPAPSPSVTAPVPDPGVPSMPSPPLPRPSPGYFTVESAGVTAPVVVRQELPRWPQDVPMDTRRALRAVLDIVIDESGAVESAAIHPSITALYDDMLMKAAARWRYKPATKDGVPVRFRKVIQVVVEK